MANQPTLTPQIIDTERLIGDLNTLKVFFNSIRSRIMRAMAVEPRSVQELATELHIPFTRLYYHIKMLEKHKLIQLVETRNHSGAVEEKYYRVTAKCYRIHRSLTTMPEQDKVLQFVENSMDVAFDKTRTEIRAAVDDSTINLASRAPELDTLLIERKIAHLSPDQARKFYQRLSDLLDEFDRADTPGTQPYQVAVAMSPIKPR